MSTLRYCFLGLFLVFMGCSSDALVSRESDKQVFKQLTTALAQATDSQADEMLVELMVRFPNSALIKPAITLLMEHYAVNGEYLLAQYYLRKLKERFFSPKEQDFHAYLELKLAFEQIKSENKQQHHTNKIIKQLEEFLYLYPQSDYRYIVGTMHAQLTLSRAFQNEKTASLYTSLNKPKAAEHYRGKNATLDTKNIIPPKKNFIIKQFE